MKIGVNLFMSRIEVCQKVKFGKTSPQSKMLYFRNKGLIIFSKKLKNLYLAIPFRDTFWAWFWPALQPFVTMAIVAFAESYSVTLVNCWKFIVPIKDWYNAFNNHFGSTCPQVDGIHIIEVGYIKFDKKFCISSEGKEYFLVRNWRWSRCTLHYLSQ